MVKLLYGNDVNEEIHNLLTYSRHKLYIYCPEMIIPENVREILLSKDVPGNDIRLLCSKDLDDDTDDFLSSATVSIVRSFPELSTCMYMNDDVAIMTDVPLVGLEGYHTGVMIYRKSEPLLYRSLMGEMGRIFHTATEIYEPELKGYCIACGREVIYNPGKPFCFECFKDLSIKYTDLREIVPENSFCHKCGKPAPVSFGRALCSDCYQVRTTNEDTETKNTNEEMEQ